MRSWFLAPLYGAVFFLLLIMGLNAEYAYVYKGRIFPGVGISHQLLGGLTPSEAESRLYKEIDEFKDYGFVVKAEERKIVIGATATPKTDPDLAYDIVSFNAHTAASSLYAYGRSGNYIHNISTRLHALLNGVTLPLDSRIDKQLFISALKANFGDLETPPKDARVAFFNGTYHILPETADGFVWDYERAYTYALSRASEFSKKPITLEQAPRRATITQKSLETHSDTLRTLSFLGPLTLMYNDKKWVVPVGVWDGWITIINGSTLSLSQDKLQIYLDSIKKDIEVEPQTTRFVKEGDRVKEFTPAQDGVSIDLASTVRNATQSVIGSSTPNIQIVTIIQKAPQSPFVDTMGITDLLGIGYSDFKGSPTNRIHNITTGAHALNGVIIQPGEEFSLIKALGIINASTGYKTELVIKGNKTTPEFGGGLCQIGTTIFRATMASGLPITERQNHSYQVSYYAENGVPGTDATIYEPKPDYKFINDTGHPILVHTKIQGTQLSFEFWGTKDGRTTSRTKPKVWNIVDPPPARLAETTDLKPGEKKCTEKPHKGADASFTYSTIYPNGDIKSQVFTSHYRPWQEVCLIGKAPDALGTTSPDLLE